MLPHQGTIKALCTNYHFMPVEEFHMWQEFREFIARGNVMDLAIAVIIGAAFGKIVTSLVEGVLMPPLGLL
jgi:hypothetical protein